jgi:LPXTG-site transpeptidase (sortase) family protein
LHIDDLDIDAPVQAVGVAADGSMEIPGPTDVGWYRFGAAPGEAGATVLAGHIAFNGVDGAFRELSEVEPGTRVDVEMTDGTLRAYQVLQVDRHRKESLPAETWTKSGPERLVLITCGGSFDPERRRYDSNIVATAAPIRE